MDLETERRRQNKSLSSLLDQVAREWLQNRAHGMTDAAEQAKLHAEAEKAIGRLAGMNPKRLRRPAC